MQPGQSAISFTKPTVVLRVRPPAPVGPCTATNCSAALKATDAECNVVGSGANHVLTSQYFDSCNKAFKGLHADELKYLNKDEQDLTRYQLNKLLTGILVMGYFLQAFFSLYLNSFFFFFLQFSKNTFLNTWPVDSIRIRGGTE